MSKQYILNKLKTTHENPVRYGLENKEELLEFNQLIGKSIHLIHSGKIYCINCGKQTKKSYAQGHCYPCSIKLASCDMCILKPETCHYDKGTCREPEWGLANCFRPHIVYLANSSGIKVGITRKSQVPFRWMDQGATEALPILEVKNRFDSGRVEVLLKKYITDKTDWRKMLKGEPEKVDLFKWRDELLDKIRDELKSFEYTELKETILSFNYPVDVYPEKVSSINLEKKPEIKSKLMGIKGQYLIFADGVMNVRSHAGFEVSMEVSHES